MAQDLRVLIAEGVTFEAEVRTDHTYTIKITGGY